MEEYGCRNGLLCTVVMVALISSAEVTWAGDSPVVEATKDAAFEQGQFVEAWETMCAAQVDSARFDEVRSQLRKTIEQLSPARRVEAAAALMDRRAPENINAAALRLFGRDPLPIEQVRRILFDSKRTFDQRVLVRTYFSLTRSEHRTSQLTEKTTLQCLEMLTDRVESLTGKPTGYGEQRLLTHLSQSLLRCYARKSDEVPQMRWFLEALDTYGLAAANGDVFAESIRGWTRLLKNQTASILSLDTAFVSLGHWDPLVRWRASRFLARWVEKRPDMLKIVFRALSDPRDEVRATAVAVLGIAANLHPQRIVGKLVDVLRRDRGVTVQAAAAAALAARQQGTAKAIAPLLMAFKPEAGGFVPGPKRTSSILTALAHLADDAVGLQRDQMLELAINKLHVAPSGALALIKALGPSAKAALDEVKAYRNGEGRVHRNYIDRHVLPAIAYGTLKSQEK